MEYLYLGLAGSFGSGVISGPPRTISFDPATGRILLDGEVLAEGVNNLSFRREGDLLTIDLDFLVPDPIQATTVLHQLSTKVAL